MAIKQDMLPHLSPVWPHYTPIIASRAKGSYVYDQDGSAYLDFTCGTWDNTVRWIPPLTVDDAQINQAVDMFTEALKKTVTYKNVL